MPEPEVETTTIEVGALARVEGEGALHVRVRGGEVESVRLEIFEPPRFFEALLRGRRFSDAPDITSRICGICPIAYQLSACAAIEDALGIEVSEPIRALRRLIYCGEWLESHALHVFMLHAPDFLDIRARSRWPTTATRPWSSTGWRSSGRQPADRGDRRAIRPSGEPAGRGLLPCAVGGRAGAGGGAAASTRASS